MSNKFKGITENIITKSKLVHFLDDITTAKNTVFKGDKDSVLNEKVKNKVSQEFYSFLKEQEKENNLGSKNQQKEFLEELTSYLQNLPQVKINLAFSPSNGFLKELSSWIKNEVGEKAILDLTINHKISGGIIIEYKGKYLDLSLANKINESIAQKSYE